MDLRASLIAAAVKGSVVGVVAHIDDHIGHLHAYLACVLGAHDLPVSVKRVIWSGMVHRAGMFQTAVDATHGAHALALLSAIESDRYVNHLAQIVFQPQRPPPQPAESIASCVIAPMTLPPPTSPIRSGKRNAGDSSPPSSNKHAKLEDEVNQPSPPPDTQDGIDDMVFLAMKMDKRAAEEASTPTPASSAITSTAPLVLPDEILTLVSAITKTPSSASSDICDAILDAGTALLQLPEHCSTAHLELLCEALPLPSLSDEAVLLLTTYNSSLLRSQLSEHSNLTRKLLEAKWTSQDAAVLLDATLFLRIQNATAAIPRSLLKALLAVASALPHVAVDRILVPILTSPNAIAAQCEAMTRLVRDGLGPQLTPVVVTRLLNANVLHSPHDRVLLVVQQIFNAKAPLSQDVVDHVVDDLGRAVADSPATTTASIKFASVLFTLVTKYGPLCVRHRDALLAVAAKCTSSMAKTALRAIDKLSV